MTQEVQVILTLDVDATITTEEIKSFVEGLIYTHETHSSALTNKFFDIREDVIIREEREIYDNE